jgi:hypothetical protein
VLDGAALGALGAALGVLGAVVLDGAALGALSTFGAVVLDGAAHAPRGRARRGHIELLDALAGLERILLSLIT